MVRWCVSLVLLHLNHACLSSPSVGLRGDTKVLWGVHSR